jgi:hypothetical protein
MGGYASSAAASMYTLRVSDGGGASRTGMPSTAGQGDERSAAGQQGGRVYHLMADSSTDLSKHVGHQVEVTGTLSTGAGGHHGMSSSAGSAGTTATTSGGAAGAGSGSTGYTGQATSGSGSTGSGAAGGTGAPSAGSTSAVGSIASQAQAAMGGMLHVTNLKMIASTCK